MLLRSDGYVAVAAVDACRLVRRSGEIRIQICACTNQSESMFILYIVSKNVTTPRLMCFKKFAFI